jgi:hypothetical protein
MLRATIYTWIVGDAGLDMQKWIADCATIGMAKAKNQKGVNFCLRFILFSPH